MKRNIANTVIVCVALMSLFVGLSVHRILSPTILSHDQLNELGLFVYDVPRNVDDFTLVDQHGAAFTQQWFEGKWSLLFFGYTYCPDICPITLATMRQFEQVLAQEDAAVAEQVQVAMISVDPQRDTQEKLAQYMAFFDPDYVGATGEYIDIFNLARQLNVAFGYQPQADGSYLVNHSGQVILINPRGHFQGFFKTPHDPEKMAKAFRSVVANWR